MVPFRCPRSTTAPDARKSGTGKAQLGLPEQGMLRSEFFEGGRGHTCVSDRHDENAA